VVSHCRCLQLGTSSSKILDNKPGFELYVVRLCFECLVAAISGWQPHSGVLEASIVHFLRSLIVIGQDSFIAMLSMDYLEPTMISSISSDNFGIINGDVVGAKWRVLPWYCVGLF